MKRKILGRIVPTAFVILTLAVVGAKLYSTLTLPKVRSWNHQQLEKINHSQTKFSFVVFGDNKNSITTFNNLISKLNKEDILFSINNGDLVYDGGKEKYRSFIKQIKKLKKPFLTVLGNHDIQGLGRANYNAFFGKPYYSFVVGNSYFIILDDANEKGIGSKQLNWLKQELKSSQDYKYRFVFMHVPLYDPRKGVNARGHSLKDLDFAKKLNKLFDRNNITMLFTSHIHAYYKGVWGRTPYIITGGGGAELVGTDPKHFFHHYIKVNVSDSAISYEVIKLKNPSLGLVNKLIYSTWAHIYSFLTFHFSDSILILALIYLAIYIVGYE